MQPGSLGVGDVPYLDAGEVALNDVGSAERQVGIDELEVAWRAPVDEVRGGRRRRDEVDVPGGLGGIHPAGAEAHPRVGAGRRRGEMALGWGARRDEQRYDREQRV